MKRKVQFIFILILILICIYGYNSGSCKLRKNYICNDDFCLYKEFKMKLPDTVKQEIELLLINKSIQKRVNIETYPQTISNCAFPNKKGVTIQTSHVQKYAPELIHFYQKKLCDFISEQLNIKVCPTSLELPTSCVLLIYENEGDWINWHYDYNYYNGRFFTVLIPITDEPTCTEFQFKKENDEIKTVNLINNNSICFEGNYLYHRATKLCKNQKRVILSCQFVTDNSMTFLNKLRLKLKDFAYIGKL